MHLFSQSDCAYVLDPKNKWYCCRCNESIFPCYDLDDESFVNFFEDDLPILHNDKYLFNPFELQCINDDEPLTDIDPDANYFALAGNTSLDNSNYFTTNSFKTYINKNNITNDNLSFIHFNVRSLSQNITELSAFLETLCVKFSCICLTETWLRDNTVDLYNMSGYNHIYKYRENRPGGGVSIFLHDSIPFKIRDDLSSVNDNYECLFIEVNKSYFKSSANIIIGVVYRIPGTNMNLFNDFFENITTKIKEEKKLGYSMGDYNINLLNTTDHTATNDFVNIALSNSFIPLITRPTRITQTSSTLIDNIFTNNFQDNICLKGILVNDITDHFPVFVLTLNVLKVLMICTFINVYTLTKIMPNSEIYFLIQI
jgi:exonuclease III